MDYILASRLLSDKGGIPKQTEHFFDYLEHLSSFQSELSKSINKHSKDRLEDNGFSPQLTRAIENIIALTISCTSAYLAWSCNQRLVFGRRLALTVLAFLFGMFYLVYSISFITTQCSKDNINFTAVAVAPPS